MAKSAKEEAKKQLGTLDLSYLDKERETAQNTYNTSKSSLENNFNNLINQINSNRQDTRKNFNTGRATVAESSYDANRANQTDLASRVIGTSGLKGLGEVGNRIETGRQYSNLANQFYNDMSELETTETQGRSQYDIDQQSLKNTYDQTMASIGSREGEAKNNYNLALGQLAEQIQGRWDSNANAANALAEAKKQSKQQLKAMNQNTLKTILTEKGEDGKYINNTFDKRVAAVMAAFGVTRDFAEDLMNEMGYQEEKTFTYKPEYASNYYYNKLINGEY